jgi:hypothetical protein
VRLRKEDKHRGKPGKNTSNSDENPLLNDAGTAQFAKVSFDPSDLRRIATGCRNSSTKRILQEWPFLLSSYSSLYVDLRESLHSFLAVSFSHLPTHLASGIIFINRLLKDIGYSFLSVDR